MHDAQVRFQLAGGRSSGRRPDHLIHRFSGTSVVRTSVAVDLGSDEVGDPVHESAPVRARRRDGRTIRAAARRATHAPAPARDSVATASAGSAVVAPSSTLAMQLTIAEPTTTPSAAVADGFRLLGGLDAEADADRQLRLRFDARHGRRDIGVGAPSAVPVMPVDRDVIDEARGVAAKPPANAGRRWWALPRRMKLRPAFRAGKHSSSSISGGRSTTMRPSTPAAIASREERVHAADVDRVVVAHQDDRRLVWSPARKSRHQLQASSAGSCRSSAPAARGLDGRAIRHRIGEGHTELDEIRAGAGQSPHQIQRQIIGRVTCSDEGCLARRGQPISIRRSGARCACRSSPHPAHSLVPKRSATAKMSLSPRPHRFITSRWSFSRLGRELVV